MSYRTDRIGGPGIYVASRCVHAARWRALRDAGWPITATWIDEADEGQTVDWPNLWDRCLDEAATATVCLVYSEAGETLKGALVELGAALRAGVPVLWVGPCSNVTKHRRITVHSDLTSALADTWRRFYAATVTARRFEE